MNDDIYKKSVQIHKDHGGKLSTTSKLKLDTKEALSLAYSPGVAGPCLEIEKDQGLAKVLTLKKNTIAVISDGSSVLGLGNIGALAAIPVMEGKAAIFKEFAGVDAFPICLDTQDTEEIIKAVKQLAPVFGGVNLEDISAPRCFEIEKRLRSELDIPVMHDDQWGAATVTLAATINALKLRETDKEGARVVLSGLGAAGVATARLLIQYGITNIVFCDSKGVVHADRTDLTPEKIELLAASTADSKEGILADAVQGSTIFIGLSKGGVLTEEMVKTMQSNPIIFALANPEPEITPELAYRAGALVVGTGRSDYPNQINNALVFPGLFKGMLERGGQFDDDVFLRVAEALAAHVEIPTTEYLIPNVFDKEVVNIVYKCIIEQN
jgi:malate dehydrogenase (oxaloacetate-decarboxylating)